MKIFRSFKTELDLNNRQRTACMRHADAARYAYNWGLARKREAFNHRNKIPSAIDLHRELNVLKKTELSWMYEVSKCAPQEALRDLDRAFAQFFRRIKKKQVGKHSQPGFPKFKTKKNGNHSFRLTGIIHVFESSIQLPRLGVLRLKERGYLPVREVHVLSATVSEKCDRWFVSLHVEMELPEHHLPQQRPSAGVDLGINRMAQVSDGTSFQNPRPLKSALRRLKRLHRQVSRCANVSTNRKKARHKLAKAHYRVANIRKNALHQVTTTLTKTKSVLVLEDLHISGMLKNPHLARAIADVGMYEFRRQIGYKGNWYGCEIRFADRFYPSTKRCSRCGQVKKKVALRERTFQCENCGLRIDRDLNAAVNLEALLYA